MGQFDRVKLDGEGQKKLRQAYKQKGLTQAKLAEEASTSVDSVKRLLGSKTCLEGVERWIVENVLKVVDLDPFELGISSEAVISKDNIVPIAEDINTLVERVRNLTREKVQELCGMMRVLDMSQPIGLNRIFTKVNIFEKIKSRQRRELSDFFDNVSFQETERFIFSDVIENRVPGLEVISRFNKLIILGRPGAGKTTFLKYLAMQCIEEECIDKKCLEERVLKEKCIEEFCSEKQELKKLIPFFITLKDFAEVSDRMTLSDYIESLFQISSSDLHSILNEGRALLLLDGLDEIREIQKSTTKRQIESFIRHCNYYRNKFIITCRLASTEYNFENFTEVEIADFDGEQISNFVYGWFSEKTDKKQPESFLFKLKSKGNEAIRELATNPLLLTLLCLVFEDSGNFPPHRSELYKDGVDVLLKKWDAKRYIERVEVYKNLSPKHKENLLSQIAYSTFLKGSYVFREETVADEIIDYIERLPRHEQDAIEIDGREILKAIEGQHGLLVEQARGIYSFSHLTFHEYFAAKHIIINCDPNSIESPMLVELMQHLNNRTWREVFLLTCEMIRTSDNLLKLMKKKTDELLAESTELQEFLRWANIQSKKLLRVVGGNYNTIAIRACYLDFDILLDQDRVLGWLLDKKFTINFTCASFLARVKHCQVQDTFQEINEIPDLSSSYDLEPAMAITFARSKAMKRLLEKGRESNDSTLAHELLSLYEELPVALKKGKNDEETLSWFKENGKEWGNRLRQIVVPHYSLGGPWKDSFDQDQKRLLDQFYHANLLLVACLRSDCCVKPEIRKGIEETLLLPIA